ncbi:MAG: glycerol-3-phosphate 1-O-acyltransferase PlsY [Pseudomonadota bacterium]
MLTLQICFVSFLAGYVLGSIPTGYLAGRICCKMDIREHGSRSTGATNVLRILGPLPAFIVLSIDFFKGFTSMLVGAWVAQSLPLWLGGEPQMPQHVNVTIALAGLGALLGHSRSIWLNFSGGKAAATGLGVLCAMSASVGLSTAFAFVVTLITFRIVSLSSLVAAFAAAVLVNVIGEPLPFRVLVVLGAAYVFALHRMNILRLFNGLEPRLGKRGPD